MRRLMTLLVAAFCVATIAGCGGDGRMRIQGKLVKGGQVCIPKEGELYAVYFVPVAADGKPPKDFFVTEFDQSSGTFVTAGKDLKGMPPGKYRVAVELTKNRKDLLGGQFDSERSPILVDVDEKTKEIVVDLATPSTNSGEKGRR